MTSCECCTSYVRKEPRRWDEHYNINHYEFKLEMLQGNMMLMVRKKEKI